MRDAILDTGSSLIYVPTREFASILVEIQRFTDCEWYDRSQEHVCDCPRGNREDFPTISILLGGTYDQHWFYLKGEDYMIYDKTWNRNKCVLTIRQTDSTNSDMKMWLLGDPFLRAYYSIHDMQANKIGLVGIAETIRQVRKSDGPLETVFDVLGIDEEESVML